MLLLSSPFSKWGPEGSESWQMGTVPQPSGGVGTWMQAIWHQHLQYCTYQYFLFRRVGQFLFRDSFVLLWWDMEKAGLRWRAGRPCRDGSETPWRVLRGRHRFWLTSRRFSTYPELTTIAVIQLQNVSVGGHRGQGRLFPRQRSAVVVGAALLQL